MRPGGWIVLSRSTQRLFLMTQYKVTFCLPQSVLVIQEMGMSYRHAKKWATMAANLEAKTGRSVAEWVTFVHNSGCQEFSTIVSWLKEVHGLGHFQARMIAEAHRAHTD